MDTKFLSKYLLLAGLGCMFVACTKPAQKSLMKASTAQPPVAAVEPHEMNLHGDTRVDNYYWLKDRDNPKVINYLEAENAYLEQVMAPLADTRKRLFEEMKGRIKEKDESVPYKDGEYYYYSRFVEGAEYPVYCRRRGTMQAPEEILLDGNTLGKGHSYFNIGGFEISDDDQLMAYGIDTVSRRNYTLRIKNLRTGDIFPEEIPMTEGGSYAWATDNKTLFYLKRDAETLLSYQVYRHTLNTPVEQDVLVYEEKDPQFYMGLYRFKSKKYIGIYLGHNGISTEYLILDASQPTGQFKTFLPRRKGHEYFIDHYQDTFYIRTNSGNSPNYRLMVVNEKTTQDETSWREIIPHRPDVLLDNIELFKNHLVLQERKEGLLQIRVRNQSTNEEHYLEFGEPAYTAYVGTNPSFNSSVLRYGYTSLTTPGSVIDYDMDTRTKEVKKVQEVLGGFNQADYITERIYVSARDGVRVPVSLVRHKNTPLNATAPLLQYAYGSYGYTVDPTFSSSRLSLLNRGFVYAICHIRGGEEMGRHWYEDGKMFKKKNTFNDFVDCSRFLIAQKFADPNRLFAMGGSAGGLLMGAVINQAPELYRGVVAQVPFVDVVTTMLDETIPLTTGEWEEWGNPKNKASYDYMKSYSPYDNVEAKTYPNMLVTGGLHDSQVQYWEPAKWVAKLRKMKTDNNILLLKTNMQAGHGGASGRFASLEETALTYTFLLDLANISF